MLKLFMNRETIRSSVSMDPVFDYVKRIYDRELKKVTDYYRHSEFSVGNTHILVRILKSLYVDYNTNLFDYMSIIEDRAPYVANNFKLTSGKSLGKVLKSEIYGYNSLEAFLSVTTITDLEDAVNNWKELEPVKVLKHNNRDLDLLLPGEHYDYDDPVLSIFSIDLPMLALQYRSWCLEIIKEGNTAVPINRFIHQYVLPNMIKSQLNYTVINILSNITEPIIRMDKKHPFKITNCNERVHSILLDMYTHTKKKKMRFEEILKNIPAFTNDNMYDALMLSNTSINAQNRWVILLSRLQVIEFLTLSYINSHRVNKVVLKDTSKELKMVIRDKVLSKLFNGEILDLTLVTIDTLIDN